MIRESFNKNWTIVPFKTLIPTGGGKAPKPVTLPYEDMLNNQRTPEAAPKSHTGYYPDATCTVVKVFEVPTDWQDKKVVLEFEGVYTNSAVYINDDYVGGFAHGYTQFYVNANRFLKYGQSNEIRVVAKTCHDTRWYTGVGVYRNVKIMVADLVHIVPDSYRVTPKEIDEHGAVVEVRCEVKNDGHCSVSTSVATILCDAQGNKVGENESTLTAWAGESQVVQQRIYVENPKRWDMENPYLYTAKTTVCSNDQCLDEDETTFGVRTLQLDPKHGLRINGKTVKLRGACIHHDNGIIGSAAIDRAEERRAELLQKAGFNAVRSAHNPISKAFLSACDRLGIVVMDEISDVWTRTKTEYDFSTAFPLVWETLCERIVAKNYNHPCVVMYSIGNEIPETGTANGADIGRKLAEKVRLLDDTRYVLNSINTMLSVIDTVMKQMAEKQKIAGGEINEAMTGLGSMMDTLNNSDLVTYATKESYDSVDLCGYNYATSRYALDKKLFPNRVLVGSETKPMQIAENWAEILKYDHVIGDFTWTGWDYIGEAGIGKMEYEEDEATAGFYGAYPWYIGYCGDLDLTGLRRPMSYLREIIFGVRTQPYVAVGYPQNFGKTLLRGMWNSFNGIGSWTWDGYEGKQVCANVFGVGDEFVLLHNGEKVAQGELKEFMGKVDLTYQPGELVCVTYDKGVETGRVAMQTAQRDVRIVLQANRTQLRADDTDLCYVEITLQDENGLVNNTCVAKVNAIVQGSGELLGIGTGYPKSQENFRDGSFTTMDGRALVVIRPNGEGEIKLTVTAEGYDEQTITVQAL